MDESGVPDPGSLRSTRVILRATPLEAPLHFIGDPKPLQLALLAACTQALRRIGVGRNRGSGHVEATLRTSDGAQVSLEPLFRLLEEEAS